MNDSMRTLWSEQIQGILNLDLSREMRFQDCYKNRILDALRLTPNTTIADIGCGPGAISQKIAKWLGDGTKVIGVDRDINFLKYAKTKAEKQRITNVEYIEGNALDLPLSDNSVDACISHTVIEHVPNREFLLEQKRICKQDGIVCVIYCRPDKYINSRPDIAPIASVRENELIDKLFSNYNDDDKQHGVWQFLPKEYELPALFDELGFRDIRVDALALPVVIDDSRVEIDKKIEMISFQKNQLLEVVNRGYHTLGSLTQHEYNELLELIHNRFDERARLVRNNKKIWEYTIVIEQVVSGKVSK